MRRRKRGRSKQRLTRFQSGLIGVVLIVLISYGCYTKFANPLANPFTIHVRFQNANGLVQGAPVRIAGVNVGKVTGISAVPRKQAAEVTMQLSSNGLPLHANSNFSIRPRIFLEGNFFVDLYPGTPESPIVSSGHSFPMTDAREPVQLDQVLTSLQASTRQNLQTLIEQYGKAVKIGGPDYNASIRYWTPAYKSTAQVAHDFLGTRPNDLETYIDEGGPVAAAFNRHPEDLENLIAYLDSTAAAFASQNTNLEKAVAALPTTLSVAIPTFDQLNRTFPPLDDLAKTLLPGVKSSGPTIDATLPFISQVRQLVQPAELRGLANDLKTTVPALAKLTVATIPLMKNEVRPASSCIVNIVHPWSELSINDGVFSGQPGFPVRKVYQEGVDYLPGLAGESRNFDANGPYIRILGTGGTIPFSLENGLVGEALAPLESVQPALPPGGTRPPLHPNTPCETQAPITTLEAPTGGKIAEDKTEAPSAAATLFTQSEDLAAISDIEKSDQSEGLKTVVTSGLSKLLKLP